MRKHAMVAAILAWALPAEADDVYVGGSFSGGALTNLESWYDEFSPLSAGIVIGKEFDLDGGYFIAPEASLRFGLNDPTILQYDDPAISYRETVRERIAAEVSLRFGRRFGSLSAFSFAGVGLSHLATTGEWYNFFGVQSTDVNVINSPTLSFGAGLQYDFSRTFMRLDIEARHFTKPDYMDLDQVNLRTVIGIRF
ncbi:porin family protein [Rhizobium sp. CG5]|uniref:hypothetical protein n=1 Tax=Rhizobium sp. CG5 TaxID=2726076 RepID=UPI002033879D|nr:hypothetical protein [Rhizobium sp. CG5]MCM2472167.1 porin family protein [Rhizobium sp. CG5]